jgi:pyridoxal phosphate enzyme (YggS family)
MMAPQSDSVAARLARVHERIAAAALRYARDPDSITLVAASKTRTSAEMLAAYAAGQRRFGENYVQEACLKMQGLSGLDVEWHFIGSIQANKTRRLAEGFAWVHGLDRLKVAQRLSEQRPQHLPPLNVCIEVNVGGQAGKSGVPPREVPALARQVAALPRLRLRGLMAIPEPCTDFAAQRAPCRSLRLLFEALRQAGLGLDTLSMGMSADLEAAIAEGATLVRVGTDLFGPRTRQNLSLARE